MKVPLYLWVLSAFGVVTYSSIAYFWKMAQLTSDRRVKLPNLQGKIIIVTGSNVGIGKEAASKFYHAGATVILASRDEKKTKEAIEEIKKQDSSKYSNDSKKKGKAEFLKLDLGDLSSVVTFVDTFMKKYKTVDILVNNAGLNGHGPFTKDGIQQCFQVNYLGHYLLTRLLVNKLDISPIDKNGRSGLGKKQLRVVNLSSVMHHWGTSQFKTSALSADIWVPGYQDSKLYMNLLTLELNKRYSGLPSLSSDASGAAIVNSVKFNSPVLSLAVNPGAVRSEIWRNWTGLKRVALNAILWTFLSTDQGSETSVYAALVSEYDVISNRNKYSLTKLQNDNKSLWLTGHNLVPYIQPYHLPLRSVFFEKLGPFAGTLFSPSSVPKQVDKVSSDLWDFSEMLCREILKKHNLQLSL